MKLSNEIHINHEIIHNEININLSPSIWWDVKD